ncbi:Integral inner nuclear membrane protein ima1 [Cyphellophora attinorum]|uniref:Integral inner nuclear membrane protein ima1 n=1 Tax=Cyphellophora attinorum TaxID=1664694 RepID=A0A0N1H5V4_9EURO|nr:Integral inner nuclear membrane protein ima1 [Phialophora attinorum]KPI36517.1 Integral inner nuclear membrane protein ima1 [Phialophora attinorum]
MPVALRRRLHCHYCGRRSAQTHLRTFKCENCEAVNHLDENGDIKDPPTTAAATPTRYANPQPFRTSSIFCATCIKNQEIVERLIANYVPDERDSKYRAAMAGLPEYKERLHRDYPQCCANCEPRARAQMAAATRAAAAENLRVQVQKSKLKRAASMIDFRALIVGCARLGYFASIIVQLLWHYFGSQATSAETYRGPAQCFAEWPAPKNCYDGVRDLVPYALALGIFCIWWNPAWAEKLRAREGWLVGLGRFYTLQIAILVLRVAAWVKVPSANISHQQRTTVHAMLLIVLTTLTGYSMTVIRLNTPPPIDWSYEPPHCSLASPQRQNLRPWQPPTPPVEDEDAMDWAPSQNFQPRPEPAPRVPEPSPFFGKLPALGRGMNETLEPKQPIGIPPGFFDNRGPLLEQRRASIPAPMAEPSFFPTSVDTGLESLFGSVFSLGSDRQSASSNSTYASTAFAQPAATPRAANSQQRRPPPVYHTPRAAAPASTVDSVSTTFSLIISVFLLGLWLISERLLIAFPNLRLYILGSATLLPMIRLVMDRAIWSGVYAGVMGLLAVSIVAGTVPEDTAFSAGATLLALDVLGVLASKTRGAIMSSQGRQYL